MDIELKTFITLILETEDDIIHNMFNSTESFEDFLKTINLNDYLRKNIIFYIDDEMNYEMSKIYCKRYIRKNLL